MMKRILVCAGGLLIAAALLGIADNGTSLLPDDEAVFVLAGCGSMQKGGTSCPSDKYDCLCWMDPVIGSWWCDVDQGTRRGRDSSCAKEGWCCSGSQGDCEQGNANCNNVLEGSYKEGYCETHGSCGWSEKTPKECVAEWGEDEDCNTFATTVSDGGC